VIEIISLNGLLDEYDAPKETDYFSIDSFKES